jgi:hypothetical protein
MSLISDGQQFPDAGHKGSAEPGRLIREIAANNRRMLRCVEQGAHFRGRMSSPVSAGWQGHIVTATPDE